MKLFDHHYRGGRKHSVKLVARDRTGGHANAAATINTPMSVGTLARDTTGLARRIVRRPDGASLGAFARQAGTLARLLLPLALRYLIGRRSTSLYGRGVSLGLELEQIATPRSYLSLDPDVPPEIAAIRLHWELDGREIEAAAAMGEAVAAAFAAAGLGEVELDPRLVARDPAFLDSNHQMGGCRMAAGPDTGVVDRDLRVFGTDNLYVAGACTFPTGSYANPTLTAIAFALRLADRLRAGEAAAI